MGSGRGNLIGPLRTKIVVGLTLSLLHHLTPTQQLVSNNLVLVHYKYQGVLYST
jgi:hypothetical protein